MSEFVNRCLRATRDEAEQSREAYLKFDLQRNCIVRIKAEDSSLGARARASPAGRHFSLTFLHRGEGAA